MQKMNTGFLFVKQMLVECSRNSLLNRRQSYLNNVCKLIQNLICIHLFFIIKKSKIWRWWTAKSQNSDRQTINFLFFQGISISQKNIAGENLEIFGKNTRTFQIYPNFDLLTGITYAVHSFNKSGRFTKSCFDELTIM